jgi:MFS superfamily sulfate permease-like transporter
VGALPITQVIVRSSANINFGAKTKASAILHGLWLLLAVLILLPVLTLIPLASLSAILMIVGYKLAKPSLFKQMFTVGYEQFIPFVVTIIGIIATNLLNGIVIGLVVGLFFSLYKSYKNSFELQDKIVNEKGHEKHHIVLAEEVSFFNKANLLEKLNSIPSGSEVIVDFKKNKYMSYDIDLVLEDFKVNAQSRQIDLKFINKP